MSCTIIWRDIGRSKKRVSKIFKYFADFEKMAKLLNYATAENIQIVEIFMDDVYHLRWISLSRD